MNVRLLGVRGRLFLGLLFIVFELAFVLRQTVVGIDSFCNLDYVVWFILFVGDFVGCFLGLWGWGLVYFGGVFTWITLAVLCRALLSCCVVFGDLLISLVVGL